MESGTRTTGVTIKALCTSCGRAKNANSRSGSANRASVRRYSLSPALKFISTKCKVGVSFM